MLGTKVFQFETPEDKSHYTDTIWSLTSTFKSIRFSVLKLISFRQGWWDKLKVFEVMRFLRDFLLSRSPWGTTIFFHFDAHVHEAQKQLIKLHHLLLLHSGTQYGKFEHNGNPLLVPSDNQTYACVLKKIPKVVFCAEMFELLMEPCQHRVVTKDNTTPRSIH